MKNFFRKLPLPKKLLLIGLIPLLFLTFLSFSLYQENTKKVNLLGSYMDRMHQSADITDLIDNLNIERRYSFQHTLTKDMSAQLLTQRPKTDSVIQRLSQYKSSLADFASYTFLDDLTSFRTAIDSGKVFLTMVMDYYTNVLFRFNTLNALPAGSDIYLGPVYKDLVAQKLLSEMVTYLGIISANLYNALYTRQYMIEILMGTRGVYQFFVSYEKELLQKASPAVINSYNKMKSSSSLQSVSNYIGKVFTTFSYDSTYDHATWATLSYSAIDELRSLQQTILKNAENVVHTAYKDQRATKRNTLILLILAMVFVISIVVYTINVITKMLSELKEGAQKIAKGETGLNFNIDSNDAIGSLARSIMRIDENNRRLADAAVAIGNSDFSVNVQPRSSDDLLGNAIVKMKNNLQQLIDHLKSAQKEIDGFNKDLEKKVIERTVQFEESNNELRSFSYSVSHDLRSPLRAVSGYASILKEEVGEKLDEESLGMLNKIILNANKMGQLIDDLIRFSKMGSAGIEKKPLDMKKLAEICVEELLSHEPANKYNIHIGDLHVCDGDQNLLNQVWINLISNAIKYSSKSSNPNIKIFSKEDNLAHTYFVKDNGVGFDSLYADKLFGVFQRLHSDEIFAGNGIGLALVKRIVTKHKGETGAESVLDKGATFYFTIPK